MFILGKSGRIIGRDGKPDSKPAPFVSDTAHWNGKEWEYSDPPLEEPVCNRTGMTAYELHSKIMDLSSPEPGSYAKPKKQDVSVLIPAYGKKKHIKAAVESCLRQTKKPYEIVVLDMDNETEGLDFPASVRVVPHERLNAAAARNLLVELCSAEQFIFLDADDMLEEDFIEEVLPCDASIVGSATQCVNEDGSAIPGKAYDGWRERPFQAACFNLTGLLCKEAFNELGGLDESLSAGGEDSDFWCRLFWQKKWKVSFNSKAKLLYRICPGQISKEKEFLKSKELELHKNFHMYEEWLKGGEGQYEKYWRPEALRLLKGFESMWPYRDSSVMQIPSHLRHEESFGKAASLMDWYKKAVPLANESRHRPTRSVGRCANAALVGRAFDVAFDGCLSPDVSGMEAYAANPEVDLSLPVEELLAKWNVVFIRGCERELPCFEEK